MNDLPLRLSDGTLIYLDCSLGTITTYVLLEQEAWFEKEAQFVPLLVKPGMTVLDIGANVGVYSLPLARRAGPDGRVYAYEPAGEPRRLLEKSRDANGLHNLHVIAAAVSDRPRQAHLAIGGSSELNSLAADAFGESVAVTSLDEEEVLRNWGSPDFVKIDAEGEERRIIEGGHGFFTRHSPLVMFEVKAGEVTDATIADAFRALEYRIFRLLPGAPILVPVEPAETLDAYELNLFAAKSDRIAALAKDGFVAEAAYGWSPSADERTHALDLLNAQAFGPAQARLSASAIGSAYRDALAGYAMWRSQAAAPSLRYAALRFGYDTLAALCRAEPNAARLSTLARMSWELGYRKNSIATLEALVAKAREGSQLNEPFWPANARFDSIAPPASIGHWFMISFLEQLERARAFSSRFAGGSANLDWLRQQPFASTEIERRYVLTHLAAGKRLAVPERLCRPAQDHHNADLWRSGAIPNTLAPR